MEKYIEISLELEYLQFLAIFLKIAEISRLYTKLTIIGLEKHVLHVRQNSIFVEFSQKLCRSNNCLNRRSLNDDVQ